MMTHHTPQGLPPLPKPDSFLFQHEDTGNTQFVDGQQVEWGFEEHNPHLQKIGGAYTESQMQAYAREALAAQAASVEPVASVLYLSDTGLCSEISEELPWGMALYAGAPPAPASVQNASLVEKLAKRTCEANADSARFTIALQTLRASLDPDDWMGAVTMHNYIDAVLAGGSPLSQPPAVAASSPATAVDAVESLRAELDDMREQRDEALRGPWKDWAERLMNRVRKGSGYDGYDDADGVDLAGEVIEHLDIVEADNERLAAELAALQASRQPQEQQAVAEGAGDVSKAVALYEAVSAIYFDDSSDFKPALLSAIRALSPEMEEMLRDDPRSAWQKADEAKDAALATKEPK